MDDLKDRVPIVDTLLNTLYLWSTVDLDSNDFSGLSYMKLGYDNFKWFLGVNVNLL